MLPVYIFSGLGADERIFQKLTFNGVHPVYIKWITPLKNESIDQYAERISSQITTPDPILIGLSFGGMIATEVSKHIHVSRLVLISSAAKRGHIPLIYRIAGRIRLTDVLPVKLMKHYSFISGWFFGISNQEEKEILKSILSDTDPVFLRWALQKITRWQNKEMIPGTIFIHGTSDRILPLIEAGCQFPVSEGGHFMVMNKASVISAIIDGILRSDP